MKALFDLFKKGNAVADPSKWKNRQITATMLAMLIVALIKVIGLFGYEIPVDENTATAIAGGIIGVVNVVLTLTTSKTVGVPEPDAGFPSIALSTTQPAEIVPPIIKAADEEKPFKLTKQQTDVYFG